MNHEFSAGIVVYYRRDTKREYLLLHYQSGHWDFPKGHIEPGESKEVAALRELEEETGLDSVALLPGFQEQFDYFFKHPETGELTKKTVYFFVGRSNTKNVTLSFEHIGYTWLPFKQALEQLTYDNAKELLKKVEKFLNK